MNANHHNKKNTGILAASIAAAVICIAVAVIIIIVNKKDVPKADITEPDNEQHSRATEVWYDCLEGDSIGKDVIRETQLPDFPGVTFRATEGTVEAVDGKETRVLYAGMPVWNVFFCDVTGDGLRELCSTISIGSGMIDDRIVVYDYSKDKCYELAKRGKYDYRLRYDGSNSLITEKYSYMRDENGETYLSTGFLWYYDEKLLITSEKPQNYKLSGKWYPLVDSYRTIEYNPMRDFETVDSSAEFVVIGKFVEDAETVQNGENSYSINTLQVSKVLRGELPEKNITIGQDYYIDESQRLVARSAMTPMEKDSEWIYFLKYDTKREAYFAVGQAAGRYPYCELDIEKLKGEEYTMKELGIYDINEFFVYDELTDAIYGTYSIYKDAIKTYNIVFSE